MASALRLSALILVLALGSALRAEEPKAAPAPGHAAPAPGHAAPAPGHAAPAPGHAAPAAGHEAAPAPGHAAPAAGHEAAPAAGHGDAHGAGAGAHHGPEVKLPFMHRGLTGGEQLALKFVNFIIFGLVLVLPLKGALSAAFAARARDLEERLSAAEKEKAEGEAQVRELEAKMAGLEGELGSILARAETDAAAEKERVLEAARAEAGLILDQARAEIEFQRRNAEQELRALVAELAVEGATQRLRARLEGDSAAVLVDRAIDSISQRAASEGIQ